MRRSGGWRGSASGRGGWRDGVARGSSRRPAPLRVVPRAPQRPPGAVLSPAVPTDRVARPARAVAGGRGRQAHAPRLRGPPYPGLARRYYGREPTYAGEVDHRALLASLEASYDGWALSTSAAALQELLPLCPPGVRVCAWTKPGGVPPGTRGPHNTWEVVIVKPARRERPGVRDSLVCHPARGGGSLPGRKPIAFVRWVVQLLGARRGDTLDDLYPGTGVVGRVWAEVSGQYSGDTSPRGTDDGGSR